MLSLTFIYSEFPVLYLYCINVQLLKFTLLIELSTELSLPLSITYCHDDILSLN